MRTSKQIGNLIRAYANDEEGSRFTKYQINALVNNSAKKILRVIPSGSDILSSLRSFVYWKFDNLNNIGDVNPPNKVFDFGQKLKDINTELLSTEHLLNTFVVKKSTISTAGNFVNESDLVHRHVPHDEYWVELENDSAKFTSTITTTSGNETNTQVVADYLDQYKLADGSGTDILVYTIACDVKDVDEFDMRSSWDSKPTILRPVSVIYNDNIYVYPRYMGTTDNYNLFLAVEFIKTPSEIDIDVEGEVQWNVDIDDAIIYDVVSELYDIDGDTTRSAIFKEKLQGMVAILSQG